MEFFENDNNNNKTKKVKILIIIIIFYVIPVLYNGTMHLFFD